METGAKWRETFECVYLKREARRARFSRPIPASSASASTRSVSKEAWAAWLKHQTMLVNENRLNLADQRARQYLARQMENFFFGAGAEQPMGYVPPSP